MPRAAPVPDAPEQFEIGARVRVSHRFPQQGHIRTPFYLRGKTGFVENDLGWFLDSEKRANGESGEPPLKLYRVKFHYRDVWGDRNATEIGTVLMADLSDDWLEPVEA